ncbi:hypothetical protein KFK09_017463 [Dendrobium nobile]|uniref:Uncharacterized protein n=1 Tax=Dendrobium nobile TaxID=94219 RepID=A0A8T3B2D1_DENNO|nr:hypothetical protein KFK09_017463 [Dendrobium nobile]
MQCDEYSTIACICNPFQSKLHFTAFSNVFSLIPDLVNPRPIYEILPKKRAKVVKDRYLRCEQAPVVTSDPASSNCRDFPSDRKERRRRRRKS